MSHRLHSSADARALEPDPVLVRLLWQWLVLGLLVSPWLPAAVAEQIGSLWFWTLVAPVTGLLVVHREFLAAAGRRLLAPAPVAAGHPGMAATFPRSLPVDRVRTPIPTQARRMRRRSAIEPAQPRAA